MFKGNKINIVLEQYTQVIIPEIQQVACLPGMFSTGADVFTICRTSFVFDKRALAIREIIQRECLRFTKKEKNKGRVIRK